jgi:pilus assembly protein CpaB
MQTFRSNTTVMIALAVVFGGAAVFLAKTWLAHQADLNAAMHNNEPASQTTLVVAAEKLRFGMPLTSSSLREITWPSDSLPEGAYAKIDQFLSEGTRTVIQAMEPNEPVLKNKVTGPGQRAGLASLVTEGQRAVTIRVNDVNGVAGFILPNDRVDVVLSQHEGNGAGTASDVVLQNVRVLAIDQVADDHKTEPSIVKAVTIETNMTGAQKVSLASLVGTLSLTLRHAGDIASLQTRRITLGDLTRPEETPAATPFMTSAPKSTNQDMTVRVMRATEQKEYIVPREK